MQQNISPFKTITLQTTKLGLNPFKLVQNEKLDTKTIDSNGQYLAWIHHSSSNPKGEISIINPFSEKRNEFPIPTIRQSSLAISDISLNQQSMDFLASAQEKTVKIWKIPPPSESMIHDPVETLKGHQKTVNFVQYCPINDDLVSVSEEVINIWDKETFKNKISIQATSNQQVYDVQWKQNELISIVTKEKKVAFYDLKSQKQTFLISLHQAARSQSFHWLSQHYAVSTGFNHQMKKEMFLWDIRNPSHGQIISIYDTSTY